MTGGRRIQARDLKVRQRPWVGACTVTHRAWRVARGRGPRILRAIHYARKINTDNPSGANVREKVKNMRDIIKSAHRHRPAPVIRVPPREAGDLPAESVPAPGAIG
ncbi:hypothetical protein KACC15558_26180 [Brevibacterium ammoniilyticum]|uniref:Transposase n=1 Tax=Brevibacterium ammoniilyticum TaxID=1046555 RepID=A0ABP9U402_9MICO